MTTLSVVIPALDPIGLPGQPVLFAALLVLTQFLHLVFMNFVLGGNLLALGLNVAAVAGNERAADMARIFYRMMPVTLSMAITMGVAPLLFVQVLYGPWFYSANVLMGWAWFSFFVAVLVGFYILYGLLWDRSPLPLNGAPTISLGALPAGATKPARPWARLLLSLPAAGCFLWVAWVMVNNHELSLRPELWRAAPSAGWRGYTPAASTLPRFLHDLIGATAIAGLWLAGTGWWRTRRCAQPDPRAHAVNAGLVRLGLKTALVATLLQIGAGVLLLINLEPQTRASLLAFNSATGLAWVGSLTLIPFLLTVLAYASLRPGPLWIGLAASLVACLAVGMLLGREHVRMAHLKLPEGGAFSYGQWAVYAQNGSFVAFAVTLAVGLATVALMMRWIVTSRPVGDE